MAESIKEEMDIKKNDIKQEIFSPQDHILPSSTVEDTCTVYVKEEDVKIEITELKGKM